MTLYKGRPLHSMTKRAACNLMALYNGAALAQRHTIAPHVICGPMPQNQLIIDIVFRSIWGSKNGGPIARKSSPRGSQDAPGARLPLEAILGSALGLFWDLFPTILEAFFHLFRACFPNLLGCLFASLLAPCSFNDNPQAWPGGLRGAIK